MKRVKLIFVLVALCSWVIPGNVKAQNKKKDHEFGVKGGLNLSTMNTDGIHDRNVKEGFHFGVYSKRELNNFFSIQPELLYSQRGTEQVIEGGGGTVDFSMNYIDLPVFMRFDITENLNIHLGGYASYLLNVKAKGKDSQGDVLFDQEMNENEFVPFDVGLSGGIGLEWGVLDLGVRYNYGLRDAGDKSRQTGEVPDVLRNGRHSVGQIYLGIGF